MEQLLQHKYTDMPYPSKIASKTLTTASKYYAIFGGRASDEFRTRHYALYVSVISYFFSRECLQIKLYTDIYMQIQMITHYLF